MKGGQTVKNIIISVLAMQCITSMDFWEFANGDRLLIGAVMAILIWVFIVTIEEGMRSARIKKFWRDRFFRDFQTKRNRP